MAPTGVLKTAVNYPRTVRAAGRNRFLAHGDFIKYSQGCGIRLSEIVLDRYEAWGLLMPCARVIWPVELLRRWRRAWRSGDSKFKSRPEWDWFRRYGNHHSLGVDELPIFVEDESAHPLERALAGEFPGIEILPLTRSRRHWKPIYIERIGKTNIRQPRAE